jgi:uncharacterized protein (TIGR02598 family)
MKHRNSSAFSLVEVTLAIGIAAFCLITVFALVPVAVLANRNATSQTAATNVMASVIADMRATTASTSPQYGITFGTPKTLYFDGAGQFTTSLSINSRYQLNLTWSGSTALRYADLRVTWPAAATPANAAGSTEVFVAFDRN